MCLGESPSEPGLLLYSRAVWLAAGLLLADVVDTMGPVLLLPALPLVIMLHRSCGTLSSSARPASTPRQD